MIFNQEYKILKRQFCLSSPFMHDCVKKRSCVKDKSNIIKQKSHHFKSLKT